MKQTISKVLLSFIIILSVFCISWTSVEATNNISSLDYYLKDSEYNNISETSDTTPSQNSLYKTNDYVIDSYDIDIKVNENNTYDITETIDAYFNASNKHGIFRKIPLRNTITRLDGTTTENKAKITNISVNDSYSISRENDNYVIKIGSAEKTIKGKKRYIIKYNYNIGKDPLKDIDELYYNIIGDKWDTVIGNITFKITMPKEFDSDKLGFSSGYRGSIENSEINYNVDGNTISGSYNGILSPYQALTIRLELPEGYFVGAGFLTMSDYIIFAIPVIFVFISLILWYKYGKEDETVETVEFYPPNGLNSLEVGYIYKGEVTNKDVISLLIDLANKGYIKIEEYKEDEGSKVLSSKNKGFKVIKLKEYDGNNEIEKKFINGLFKKFAGVGEEVTSDALNYKFYSTIDEIKSKFKNKKEDKIFSYNTKQKIIINIMIIITILLITIKPLIEYSFPEMIIPALVFPGIALLTINELVFNNKNSYEKVFGIIWAFMFGGIPWSIMVLPALLSEPFYLVGYLIGIACIIMMMRCKKYLNKRTPYGNELYGKIKGFKTFLETVEKERLELMVEKDPTYFYNILPYTYVLGISDKWISKFETIALQPPSWYDSTNAFDVITFATFVTGTMSTANRVMTSTPRSSYGGGYSGGFSGGGSSGGGFSGGGSGGGGGGSW